MGLRFRKSIKIAPDVRINLSKSGPSVSVGGHGLTTNFRPGRKTRITESIPGTGISYSSALGDDERERASVYADVPRPRKRITATGWIMRYLAWMFFIGAMAAAFGKK